MAATGLKLPWLSMSRPGPTRLASWLVFGCGMVLAFDLGGELHVALLNPAGLGPAMFLHLVGEATAAAGLGWAYGLLRAELRRAQSEAEADRARLIALRGAFDRLMEERFDAWELSAAERDVALLTVRGLRISEIAAARGVREGTVKSQLSLIFRKSGVRTRTEFVAMFIDEFLDHAAREDGGAPDALAGPRRGADRAPPRMAGGASNRRQVLRGARPAGTGDPPAAASAR
jgi:DNA-binding CsgD family transcriptional regulator